MDHLRPLGAHLHLDLAVVRHRHTEGSEIQTAFREIGVVESGIVHPVAVKRTEIPIDRIISGGRFVNRQRLRLGPGLWSVGYLSGTRSGIGRMRGRGDDTDSPVSPVPASAPSFFLLKGHMVGLLLNSRGKDGTGTVVEGGRV